MSRTEVRNQIMDDVTKIIGKTKYVGRLRRQLVKFNLTEEEQQEVLQTIETKEAEIDLALAELEDYLYMVL